MGIFKEFDGTIVKDDFMEMIEKIHEIRKSSENCEMFGLSSWENDECKEGIVTQADLICLSLVLHLNQQTIKNWWEHLQCTCGAIRPIKANSNSCKLINEFVNRPLIFNTPIKQLKYNLKCMKNFNDELIEHVKKVGKSDIGKMWKNVLAAALQDYKKMADALNKQERKEKERQEKFSKAQKLVEERKRLWLEAEKELKAFA